jgi:CheY-like chemotaxis protein
MSDLRALKDRVNDLHVLMVDDEERVLASSISFLNKFFKNVEGARNGEEALKMFKSDGTFDVLITDIQMPYMSGTQLVEEIRKVDQNIFIASVTGSPETSDEERGLCDIYLVKPVGLDDMLQMMQTIIQKRG